MYTVFACITKSGNGACLVFAGAIGEIIRRNADNLRRNVLALTMLGIPDDGDHRFRAIVIAVPG